MKSTSFRGPHPGMLAIIFASLFISGLSFVISFSGPPYYPGPWETADTIAGYFQNHSHDVLMCAFFQFGSAIPLGILTATLVARLMHLGANPAGVFIAMFGGFATTASLMFSASITWVICYPGIAENVAIVKTLYYLGFAVGGVGYAVPLGLLVAGVSVTSGFMKLMPKWVVISGVILAMIGELSWLTMIFPSLLPLIPLTRFPGFIWLILAGFMLARREPKVAKIKPFLAAGK